MIRVLSADGKTLTFTTTGLNADGQQINDFAAYEKQRVGMALKNQGLALFRATNKDVELGSATSTRKSIPSPPTSF